MSAYAQEFSAPRKVEMMRADVNKVRLSLNQSVFGSHISILNSSKKSLTCDQFSQIELNVLRHFINYDSQSIFPKECLSPKKKSLQLMRVFYLT